MSRTASHRKAMLANMAISLIMHKRITTTLAKAKVKEVAPKVADRPGGYTRIIKLGTRQGDAADVCFIELVDFDENMAKTPKTAKKTRRSRRSKGAEAAPAATEAPVAEEAKAEAPAEEAAKAE